MSRYENDDLSHLNLPDPLQLNTVYHLEDGQELDGEAYDNMLTEYQAAEKAPPVTCGKVILNPTTNMVTYFVLCSASSMFNPRSKDARYMIRNRWKMRRVSRSTYELYIKFLRTNHQTFLYQAERGL